MTKIFQLDTNLQVIGTLPWAQYVRGAFVPDEEGGNATHRFVYKNFELLLVNPNSTSQYRYKDYWGYEMVMIEELRKVLDFNYEILNAPDGIWGLIDEEGQWVGLIGLASRGDVDFVISDILMSWTRFQVIT